MSHVGFENILIITDHFTRLPKQILQRTKQLTPPLSFFLNRLFVNMAFPVGSRVIRGEILKSTLEEEKKTSLKAHVPVMVHAYNSNRHDTTWFIHILLCSGALMPP
jgi:hypothetical protein